MCVVEANRLDGIVEAYRADWMPAKGAKPILHVHDDDCLLFRIAGTPADDLSQCGTQSKGLLNRIAEEVNSASGEVELRDATRKSLLQG